MSTTRDVLTQLVVGLAVMAGFVAQAVEEPPALISERAVFWLDAMDTSTMELAGDKVTKWTSKGTVANFATPRYDELEPIYDTTTYGIPTVDLGPLGSKQDMVYNAKVSNIRTFFLVVKIVKSADARLIGSGDWHSGRGRQGQYGRDDNGGLLHAKFDSAWDLGSAVDWKTAVVPDDSFRVICVNTTQNIAAECLSADSNSDKTTGGRQISEVIFFSSVLSDEDRAQVTTYLMKKWGFAKTGITVNGAPANYGVPVPDYGFYDDLVKGQTYTFKSSSLTNDSCTLHRECLGWAFLDANMVLTSGAELSKEIVYDASTETATLTWNWDSYRKLPLSYDYKLPSSYREVEYLEQDTGAYINTGFSLKTTTTEVLLTVGASETVDYSSNQMWAGSNGGGNGATCFQLGRYGNGWWIAGSANRATSGGGYPSSRGPLAISISGQDWLYMDASEDEIKTGQTEIIGATDGVGPILLFTVGNGNNVVTANRAAAGVRIYGLVVYDNHVCTHRLVPCYRKEGSAPGFYDVVTDTFLPQISLPNVTDGTLKVGPDVIRKRGLIITFW